ncbi:anti-repressor SinI family protein [Priestia aryabhattai]
MVKKGNLVEGELDQEWIKLIKQAYEIGLTIQEVKDFLKINER